MPSWGIHLYIADKLCKKLNVNRSEFLIGNILPDVFMGWVVENPSKILSYEQTHYGRITKVNKNSYTLPNYEKMIGNITNDLELGYFVHILTDYFFNKYTFENKYVKDENNNYLGYNSNFGFVKSDKDEARETKQLDFKIFEGELLKEFYIGEIKIDSNMKLNLNRLGYTSEDIEKTLNYINGIKNNKSSFNIKDMKMFTYDELSSVLNDAILFIESILEKVGNYYNQKIKI